MVKLLHLLPAAGLLLWGCQGAVDADTAAGDGVVPGETVGDPTPTVVDQGGSPTQTANPVPVSQQQASNGFNLPEPQPKLLPFDVRLNKIAAVVGVQPDSAVLQSLVSRAEQLGGYDFANSVLPDNNWTELKLTTWVSALRPVCGSAEFQALYPSLPEFLPQLIEAAHGRAVTDQDLQLVQQALAEAPASSAEEQSIVLCLTVLSSMEFVSR